MDFVWLILLLTAFEPALRKQLLAVSRRRLIARIEERRGSRVILLVHRQETMSVLGFPLLRYIDVNDSEELLRAIDMTDPEVPIDLILHTPGGLVLAATQIARAIHRHPGKVTVFVPHYAMSGGTLIALAADEIVMSRHAVLGPVDPVLGEYPAASLVRAVNRKRVEDIEDETLVLADQAEMALRQVRTTVIEFLADTCEREKAEALATMLSEGRWTHDHPITFEDALTFQLPVSTELPEEVVKLMSLYPQPVRRQGGVEYLPERRGS